MEIKNIRTYTAYIKKNGVNMIGYRTRFIIEDQKHHIETLSKDQKFIDRKIREYAEKIKDQKN